MRQIDADKIIRTNPCWGEEEEEEEEEGEHPLPGKPLGKVDCTVWRFEAVEKAGLNLWKDESLPGLAKDNQKEGDSAESGLGMRTLSRSQSIPAGGP